MDKKILFLIIFGMFMFGIRLANINEAIYDDESNFAYSLTVMDQFGFNHDYYSPQPLNLIYQPFIALFGLKTWVFRLVPWLFGIINTIFVYFFARRNWDEKVAFWAAFLMLVSFYPTLASLQFDVEGNLVMFCVMLMFFSYLEYEKATDKRKQLGWQILAGIGLGIAVISKFNAVYIVFILALYSLIKRGWRIKETFKDLFNVYLVGLIFFLIPIILGILASPDSWMNFLPIISWQEGFSAKYQISPLYFQGLFMYLLWSTPLLFGFFLISLFRPHPKILLPALWVLLSLIFYSTIITSGSLDRYFMHTIPALAVIGGFYISQITLSKRQVWLAAGITGIFTALLFFINARPIKYIARFPSLYLQELRNFNLNFLFSYTSASGPTFGINFAVIFWTFFSAFICLLMFFMLRKKRIARNLFVLFLSISLAFNIFMISEYLFHPTGVDVSEVKWKMVEYVDGQRLSYPIYTNDQGIQWYFENDYWHKDENTFTIPDNEMIPIPIIITEHLNNHGGTIILLRWPPLPEESPLFELLPLCNHNNSFYSQGILIGEIHVC